MVWGNETVRRVKLVESACNLDATQTHKLITTINDGGSIVVGFEQPIPMELIFWSLGTPFVPRADPLVIVQI